MTDYFHYYELILVDGVQPAPGRFVALVDTSTLARVDLYGDTNGTAIVSTSGVANMAKTDDLGNVSAYVAPGTYHVDIFEKDATTFVWRVPNVAMTSTKGEKGDTGPQGATGPADNTYSDLATFKASSVDRKVASLSGIEGVPDGKFFWETANAPYTADDTNIIKSDANDLSVGAWVRQAAENIRASDGNTVQDNLDFGGRLKQVGTGAITEKTEDAVNRTVWVESYQVGDGTGDQTAAFQAAIDALSDTGGIVRCRTSYEIGATDPVVIPCEPKIVHIECLAPIKQGAANVPMFVSSGIGGTVGRAIGCRHKFWVVAHPDSDPDTTTNIAINLTGMDGARVDARIESDSTATAATGRFYAGIYGTATGPYVYNTHIRAIFHQTWLPKNGILLDNSGAGVSSNPNVNFISVWAYACSGTSDIVNVGDTTQTIIERSLFESCTDATAIVAGNMTTIQHCWIENMGADIVFGATGSTTSNNCVCNRVQFSGATHNITVNSAVAAYPSFHQCLFGGATFTDQSAAATTHYTIVKTHTNPAAPTFSAVIISGTFDTLTASRRFPVDHHGRQVWHIQQSFTPAAAGRGAIRITPPTGYEVEICNISATDIGTAAPLIGGLSNALTGNDYEFWWESTSKHTINARIVIRSTAAT